MKKYLLFFVMVIFCVCGIVSAENEWTELDLSTIDSEELINCTIIDAAKEDEMNKAILGEITADDWSIGPEDALLTILEYADFQCPYCSNAGLNLIELQAKYPDQIRYVYRHFPLSFHTLAPTAAYAADAAGKQGKFFEAEHFLYANQDEWSDFETTDEVDAWLRENIADGIEGLDFEQWVTDYEDEALRANVDGAFDKVAATGIVGGTPTVFVNFFDYDGNFSEESFLEYGELFKQLSNGFDACPKMAADDYEYRAVVDTTAGDFEMDLFFDDAPEAVSNFIFLAQAGWYDGLNFHAIIPDFYVQTGDPSGLGIMTPGYSFANEINLNHDFSEKGVVAMANSGLDTNGSQFFITFSVPEYLEKAYYQSLPEGTGAAAYVESVLTDLNHSYTIFGKLTEESFNNLTNIDGTTVINGVKILVKEK